MKKVHKVDTPMSQLKSFRSIFASWGYLVTTNFASDLMNSQDDCIINTFEMRDRGRKASALIKFEICQTFAKVNVSMKNVVR